MRIAWFEDKQFPVLAALLLPLAVRFYMDVGQGDGFAGAGQRAVLLALVFAVGIVWDAIFTKTFLPRLQVDHGLFAVLFATMLPTPLAPGLGVGSVALAASFGWVFGRAVFGGRDVLPPALIALAFGIFSFPDRGFEMRGVLAAEPAWALALACLPGAVWLLWRRVLAWQVVAGVVVGVVVAAWVMADTAGAVEMSFAALISLQGVVGGFAPGILFVAATQNCAPRSVRARWLFGVLLGALVVVMRIATADQSDSIVFAILLCGLFAPLMDRALMGEDRHG